MLKVTNTEVFGWEAAIRGMRNPKNSWDRSDSSFMRNPDYGCCGPCPCVGIAHCDEVYVGLDDLKLMKQLVAAGNDHSKFMRMIHVQCDWEAPLYWWKEADTYKVGTVRNSCSTMNKITEHEFTMDMFAHEHLLSMSNNDAGDALFLNGANSIRVDGEDLLGLTITVLNYYRERYIATQDKRYWWQLIQLLPSSYLQKATMDFNYAVLRNMYHSRKAHKQDEWREDFCNWVKTLPYSELITMTKEDLLESIKKE